MKKSHKMSLFFSLCLLPITGYLLLNFIARQIPYQWDATESGFHSIADTTKTQLQHLNDPVTIHFYASQTENTMPYALRVYGEKIEYFLYILQNIDGGKIQVIRYDPVPGSNDEKSAQFNNISSQFSGVNHRFYFGLSISSLDNTVSIPFLHPKREGLLEYDILQAIDRVTKQHSKTIGLLSGLPVTGGQYKSEKEHGEFPAWIFIQELRKTYNVHLYNNMIETLLSSPPDLLIVIHPVNIDQASEQIIDQYVINGGKLIVMLDPFSIAIEMIDKRQSNALISSNLQSLLTTWGINYHPGRVVADMMYRSRIDRGFGPEDSHTVINITQETINTDDPITAGITDLGFAYAGYFTPLRTQSDNRLISLVSTSATTSTIDSAKLLDLSRESNEQLLQSFASDGVSRDIVVRLTGPLSPAFSTTQKRQSSYHSAQPDDTQVILFADVDFIFDPFAGETVSLSPSQQSVTPYNGNLALLSNAVSDLIGNRNLTIIHGKGSVRYPLYGLDIARAEIENRFEHKRLALLRKKMMIEEQLEKLSLNNNNGATEKNPGNNIDKNINNNLYNNFNNNDITRLIEHRQQTQQLLAQYQQTNEALININQQVELLMQAIKNRYQWINILLVPFIIFAIGVAVIYRRYYTTRAL